MMNEDNAKTMVRTRRMPFRPAPNSDPDQSVNVLPVGTHLGEFEILDLIGEGGFGIVYLAYDHSLERHVALKEYMPSGLAIRTTSMAVTVRSQHNAATFTAGLKSFINEARMLAQFDSPSLVKVHRFWEGNGTAYMVMPFYEGITLKQALKERRITPTESWIRLLLADLFDAIETIHNAHCLHRDIAPDNILLLKDGRPLLLDFGAARRVIGDLTQCLTVILKPGFAPIEQYADIAGLRQGEWTDIYALAAVVYYLVTGKAPPPAVARMVNDELVPARKAGKGRYSDAFLGVLDKALSVKPEQRYRSIAELRHALDIMGTVPRTLPGESSHWATTVARTAVKEEEPELMPSAPAKEASKPQPQHRTQPQPGARPQVRTEPKFHTRPPAAVAENPPVHPETTQYLHAAAPFDQSWMKPPQDEHTAGGRSRRDRKEWLVLGLLLSAGIASGVYVGMNRSWQNTDDAAIAASSGTATMQSSGASGTSEQETDTQAPVAAAPSAPPASSTPALPPARTAPTHAPAIASAAPKSAETSGPSQPSSPAALTSNIQSEIDLWRAASESDKASAYENYLREYPRGRYAALAKLRLERKQPKTAMLTPSEIEAPLKAQERKAKAATTDAAPASATKEAAPVQQAAREPASAIKDKDALRDTPKDTSKDAPSAKAPSGRSAEEDLWNTVTTINDGPAYEAYLYQYPKGRYAALARDKLAKPASPAMVSASPSAPKTATAPEKPPAAEAAPAAGTATAVAERPLPETLPKQASIKPAEPAASAPAVRKAPAESTPPAVPAPEQAAPAASSSATASGKKTIRTAGQTMIGDFTADPKTGIVSGTGKIVWSNGDQFEGTLVNGKKEGKGKFIWSNGQRYSGDWAQDMPNGKGVIIFTDGSRYEGDVMDGVPHGQGITRFKHGDVYRGDWVRGRSHGHGRYTWANGSYWEGEFRNDKRTENGKIVFAEPAPGSTASSSGGAGASAPPMTSGETQQAERRATSE